MSNRKSKPSTPASSTTPLLSENERRRGVSSAKATRLVPRRATCLRIAGLLGLFALIYIVFVWRHAPHGEKEPAEGDSESGYTLRIVAVGDLHSDFDNTLKVLRNSRVVDQNGDWTGEIDYFVQTGDIVDRGDDTLKIYRLMEKLRVQARHAGGNVFSHLGNHEYMNVLSDWRYVYPSEIATFGGVEKRQYALSAAGFPGAAWAANYTSVSRIPLHPTSGAPNEDYNPSSNSPLSHAAYSFMHGGLSPRIAQLYGTPYPSTLNKIGASLLRRCQTRTPPPPHPPAPYPGLPPDSPQNEYDFYGSDGPVWFRGWAESPDHVVCAAIDEVLNFIGVKRMIIGHTPNFKNIVSRCNGKIIIIDTGISRAYNGALSALSVTYTLTPIPSSYQTDMLESEEQNTTALTINATEHVNVTNIANLTSSTLERRKRQWREREHIQALYYPNRHQDLVIDERVITGNF